MTSKRQELAARCHDIQVSLGNKEVPEFEAIPEIGMAVRLALHLRGLPLIKYDLLKLVSFHFLHIPGVVLKTILNILAEIEFIDIISEGSTIKAVLPKVPYFDDLYEGIGEFAEKEKSFNESEQLSVAILKKLTKSPIFRDTVFNIGAETKQIKRTLQIGQEGGYLYSQRARGRDIIISPLFFSENADLYADIVAKSGADNIQRILKIIKECQGWPLSLIETTKEVNGVKLKDEDISFLKRLAQDGAVKPPSINTTHAGSNYFMFTPAPGEVRLSPTNREIYERAMALVASVRQGQLLPKEYAIRSPIKILTALRDRGYIRANTEAFEQYRKLTVLRVGRLENAGHGWYRFCLNDVEESRQALDMAIELVSEGHTQGLEVDEDVRIALQKDQMYVESLISSQKLRERESVLLTDEQQAEIENLILGGVSN
ncbi:MAG: hypothetical protein KGZ89_04665 [Actinobacteria bacterium]|nr:hypothetical protein [Actinomycetota bacterium]